MQVTKKDTTSATVVNQITHHMPFTLNYFYAAISTGHWTTFNTHTHTHIHIHTRPEKREDRKNIMRALLSAVREKQVKKCISTHG